MAAVVEGKQKAAAKQLAATKQLAAKKQRAAAKSGGDPKKTPATQALPAQQALTTKAPAKKRDASSQPAAQKADKKPDKKAAKPRGVQLADWYDYPQYFDMVFRDETEMEVEFFEEAFKRFATGSVKEVMEPGCGSGRLIAEMAARGYQCTGLDLSVPSLAYLRNRLKRRGLKADVLQGDMTAMDLRDAQGKRKLFDAVFCTFNTFRHLTTEEAAVSHLQSVADHLRPGGLYILGLHILPPDVEESCVERWTATHAQTKVHVTLRVIEFMRRKRLEQIRVTIKADKPGETIKLRTEFPLRLYTAPQILATIASVPDFEIASVHDFNYEIDEPVEVDDDSVDTIFILRKVGPQKKSAGKKRAK